MTNLEEASTKRLGGYGVFVTLRIQLGENANKSYHVYKVIHEVVLHYNKSLGIRLAGHNANKKKVGPYIIEYHT